MNLNDIVLNYLTDNEKGIQQLITWILNDVMKEEVAQQAGVPRHARSSSRRAYRDGYRSRSLKTRFGELSLIKPQLREIPFETKVFERYSRTEKALVNAIIAIWGKPQWRGRSPHERLQIGKQMRFFEFFP